MYRNERMRRIQQLLGVMVGEEGHLLLDASQRRRQRVAGWRSRMQVTHGRRLAACRRPCGGSMVSARVLP